ncbi:MAG TPA: ATP-binding protein [Candidatus Polarisedimenticolaceae bacterium]|nr:ATP-binding protein [Candidatus Polarisedimenticolaceae bacterium]
MLAILIWVAHTFAFQGMSRLAARYPVLRAQEEATRVAEAAASMGRGPTGMDFYRLQRNRRELEAILAERLAERPYLRFVEIRDRFDIKVAFVGSEGAIRQTARTALTIAGQYQGSVRVGIAAEPIDREIDAIRKWLAIRVAIVAAVGVALLVVGLFYVLYLIRKNRSLEHQRQSSERAAYRGVLGSGLAHEIRNPLNSMNMNLQMLEEELQGVPALEGGEHVEMLRSMQGEIKRIKNLIDNFLQYARPATPQLKVVDLNEVLGATARFLQADFRQSGVELQLDLEPLLPSVELDESQLRQALLNILGNARHVVPAGGRVVLRSRAGAGGEILIEVGDTGPGIPAEMIERIFEPFYSKRAGGTGLGLAIARQMVENHGGRIEVESQTGVGTTFRIRLPRRHSRALEPPGVRAAP